MKNLEYVKKLEDANQMEEKKIAMAMENAMKTKMDKLSALVTKALLMMVLIYVESAKIPYSLTLIVKSETGLQRHQM